MLYPNSLKIIYGSFYWNVIVHVLLYTGQISICRHRCLFLQSLLHVKSIRLFILTPGIRYKTLHIWWKQIRPCVPYISLKLYIPFFNKNCTETTVWKNFKIFTELKCNIGNKTCSLNSWPTTTSSTPMMRSQTYSDKKCSFSKTWRKQLTK